MASCFSGDRTHIYTACMKIYISHTRNARVATKAATKRPAMDRTGPELAALPPLPVGGGGGGGVDTPGGVNVAGGGGVAVGAGVGVATAALTVTESFMPPVQCPGKLQM